MIDPKILVTGANGQLGRVLTHSLRVRYGSENVIASDISVNGSTDNTPYETLNVLDKKKLTEIIETYEITQIYHLAAILSANGEKNHHKTWDINLNGLIHILDAAVDHNLDSLFFPSTIGVFGPTTPKTNTPQYSPLLPSTAYGMSKVTGEMWCNYYYQKYGLDVRSLRYPGIIGYQSIPEGGTTDYAVEIFHKAIEDGKYTCFLSPHTRLPMIYMDDAIRATIELMEAPAQQITVRSSYNLSAVSFTPAELMKEIQQFIPELEISYKPDFRQAIAESWCQSIDDTVARRDWNWEPKFGLPEITKDMIHHIKKANHV